MMHELLSPKASKITDNGDKFLLYKETLKNDENETLKSKPKSGSSAQSTGKEKELATLSARFVTSSARNLKRKTSSPIRLEPVAISPVRHRNSVHGLTSTVTPGATSLSGSNAKKSNDVQST